MASAPAQPSTPGAAQAPARDTHEQLQGVLWIETAGEYWGAARSIYAGARSAIDRGLSDRKWTAAIEQTGNFGRLPAAVILDLDETVFDNSRFQGRMVLERKTYDADLWNTWVEAQSSSEVPGAVDFVHYAELKKVHVFFVTNRTAAQEPASIATLARMNIVTTPDSVLSTNENGWNTSDKSPRRAFVAEKYRILALVGDDLNDFVSLVDQSSAQRLATARKNVARWGAQWFLVPNPIYGGWDRALTTGVSDDAAVLAKKRSLVTAF